MAVFQMSFQPVPEAPEGNRCVVLVGSGGISM
jgi:hypothetical protein